MAIFQGDSHGKKAVASATAQHAANAAYFAAMEQAKDARLSQAEQPKTPPPTGVSPCSPGYPTKT